MPARSNERLCKLAQAGDTTARDILLEKQSGLHPKNSVGAIPEHGGWMKRILELILDDLVQEGKYRPAERNPFV